MRIHPFRCVPAIVAFLLTCACASTEPATIEQKPHAPDTLRYPPVRLHLIILHTNDVHGQVLTRKATWLDKDHPPMIGGLPRVMAYVNQVRDEVKKAEDADEDTALIVVDAGDWYQGTPEGLVDNGMGFVQALALVGYDAMCIGNHEFDHGIENVVRLVRDAKLPAVCANLQVRATGKPVDWVPPWRIITRGFPNLKIAIVGLLTPVTPEITSSDVSALDFTDPNAALDRCVRDLDGTVDWVLPITHLGVEADRELARKHPWLPLIIGGHSHTYLKEGVTEGNTLIVQSGSKASAIGRVDLVWSGPPQGGNDSVGHGYYKLIEALARLIDLTEEPKSEFKEDALEFRCAKLEEQTAEKMKEVVGTLTGAATRSKDPLVSGSAGNLIADLCRERAHADVGLMNRGGIRTDIEAGPVTRRGVFEVMPFDNTLVVLTMTGAELEELLRRAVEGVAHSGIEISGVVLDVSVDAAKKRKLEGVKVDGKSLDSKASYRVAMNSFMADGGDAYIEKREGATRKDGGVLIRDVLEEAFLAKKTITPPSENRYHVRGP